MTVLVCHGGSGTVLGALGAGLPMVVVPLFATLPTIDEAVDVLLATTAR